MNQFQGHSKNVIKCYIEMNKTSSLLILASGIFPSGVDSSETARVSPLSDLPKSIPVTLDLK